MTSLPCRLLFVAALLAPLCAPRIAHACVSSDFACSGELPGDPCITQIGYGRCVSIGCAEMPASSCIVDIKACDNPSLLDPCADKQSGETCSLADGGATTGTCQPFTCGDDGGTLLGCYVPLPADTTAPGRAATGGTGSSPNPSPTATSTASSSDGTSPPAASDASSGGCAMSPRSGAASSFVVIALGALAALGRRRRARE